MSEFQDVLIQPSPEFIVMINADGKVTMMNDFLLKALGYTLGDTYGVDFIRTFVPDESRATLSDHMERCILSNGKTSAESFMLAKNGRKIPVEWVFRPILGAAGMLDFILGIGVDLSTQKDMGKRLRENENLFRSLFKNNPAPMLLIDPATARIVDSNDAAVLFYGYPADVLSSMKVTELNTLPEKDVFDEMASALSLEKNSFRFTHRLADGTLKSVEVLSNPIVMGENTLLYSVVCDVTERKRMEEELIREREEQLLLFDSIPLIIFFKNRRNRYVRVNRAFCDFFGLSKKQVEGSTAWELFPENAERFFSDDTTVIETGRSKHSILSIVDTPHGTRWLQTDKVPFRDEKGEIIGVVGYSADVTEPKNVGEAIHALVDSGVDSSEPNMFDHIAERMGIWLGTSCIMVARCTDGVNASVLSMLVDGVHVPARDFAVTGTPAEEVIRSGFMYRRDGLNDEFSACEEIFTCRTEGFAGISICDSSGAVVGFLCAWSKTRLLLPNRAEEVMRIFASKAYAEMERMRSEDALRESEERYRTLVETSPDAIIMMDFSGLVLMINRQTAIMVGFDTVEQAMEDAQTVFDFIVPEDRERVKKVLDSLVNESGRVTGSFDVIRVDSSRLPVEVSASLIRNATGEPIAVIAIIRDITERKVAEQQLIEKHSHLEAMLKNERMLSEVASMINSAETLDTVIGRIVGIISEAISVSRISICRRIAATGDLKPYGGHAYMEEGRGIEIICSLLNNHPELSETLAAGKSVLIDDTSVFDGPVGEDIRDVGIGSFAILPLAAGGVEKGRIVFSRYEPTVWTKGEGDLFRIIADMISNAMERDDNFMARLDAEKKHAEVLRLAERSSRLASIGTLAAGISHEINQPLTALKVKVDSLLYWSEINETIPQNDLASDLAFISQQAERIDDIIKHMRALARQEKGHEPTEINVNHIIEDVLSLLRQRISAHGIQINLDLAGDLPRIRGHRTLIHQVIINLVVNAIHALDEFTRQEKAIFLRTGVREDSVIIEVLDNGPGIAEENLNQIFDPFFTTKIGGEGMGIGLSICHNIITGIGGIILAENRPEGGARFEVSIPIPKVVQKKKDSA